MKCKFGCNFDCKCNEKEIIISVNNSCNLKCSYCFQAHSTKKFHFDRNKFVNAIIMNTDVSSFNIMGGEFTLLEQEDQEFVFNYLRNNKINHVICTNNLKIEEEGIIFFRHITNLRIIPDKDKRYNIVLEEKQLKNIFEFLEKYHNINFHLHYDRTLKYGYKNEDLLLKILNLSNVRVQAYSFIKKVLEMNSKTENKHGIIKNTLNKLCKCSGMISVYDEY